LYNNRKISAFLNAKNYFLDTRSNGSEFYSTKLIDFGIFNWLKAILLFFTIKLDFNAMYLLHARKGMFNF
jgi:hypothetical protein